MVLPMFILLEVTVFVTQLVFCIFAKKLWIKLLPVAGSMLLAGICWLLYISGIASTVYGADFALYIYGIVLLSAAAAAGFAWAVYGIVKIVQNRRK